MKKQTRDANALLMAAMREAVKPYLTRLKLRSIDQRCDLCGQAMKGLVTILYRIPYRVILKQYLYQTGRRKPGKFLNEEGKLEFFPSDWPFRDEWIVFHNSHEALDIIHSSCSLGVQKDD